MSHHSHLNEKTTLRAMAASATLHCLTGCAIGEVIGLIIGTAAGLSNLVTTIVSIVLAFVFGFTLSSLPLLKAGLSLGAALSIVVVADSLSITTMELIDNITMLLIPGAMDAGLVNSIFWIGMIISLTVAFFAAWPVNAWLLKRGKGHALMHEYHHAHKDMKGARKLIPSIPTSSLVAVIIAFILGGLVVSIADDINSSNNSMNMSAMNDSLKNKRDDEFDKAFISSMIAHHEGAVDMAKQAETQAKHQEIKQLSKNIIAAQEQEIRDMKQWQMDWGYERNMSSMHTNH